jgi:hypothetical protein
MAGRGARPHLKPPPKPFIEVPETSRLIKMGPDALERRESELAQKWKERIAKEWTKKIKDGQDLLTKKVWPDGSSFEGEVIDGKKEGYGIYIDRNGNFFQGVWKNDKKEGFFVIRYSNGEQFEGFFENDKRNGEGMHRYPDGSKFRGEYLNDMRHGRGCYWTRIEYYTHQKMFFRKYHYGTLIEEYEIYTSTQRDSECPGTGFGTIIDSNGVKYEGDFVNYKRYMRQSRNSHNCRRISEKKSLIETSRKGSTHVS